MMNNKDLKVAVVGGRNFSDYSLMKQKLDSFNSKFRISMIISGGAKGADEFAYRYAVENGIVFVCYPPDPRDGFPKAYYRRNLRIAETCEVMLAFPTRESKGTWHSISLAKKLSKKVWVFDGNQ